MNQTIDRIQRINSRILAMYLFQYSLLIPFMSFINGTILVAAFSFVLIVVEIIINRKVIINKINLLLYLLLLLFLIFKTFYDGSELLVIEYFIMISIASLLVISFPFDGNAFLDFGYRLALLNFFLLSWNPFFGKYEYMRFGYGMVLTVIFLFIKLVYLKGFENAIFRILAIVVLSISFLEIVLYGARGSIIVVILYLLLDFIFIHKEKIFRNITILCVGSLIYYNLVKILGLLQMLANRLGIYSYSLMKFQKQIEEGMTAASSGRSELYAEALQKIKLHPLIGNPIKISDEDGLYVHNIFLQVGQDLGVFAIVLVITLLIISLYLLQNNSIVLENKEVLAILFAVSIGRLLFSSILWRRPEYWLLISYTLILINNRLKRVV